MPLLCLSSMNILENKFSSGDVHKTVNFKWILENRHGKQILNSYMSVFHNGSLTACVPSPGYLSLFEFQIVTTKCSQIMYKPRASLKSKENLAPWIFWDPCFLCCFDTRLAHQNVAKMDSQRNAVMKKRNKHTVLGLFLTYFQAEKFSKLLSVL